MVLVPRKDLTNSVWLSRSERSNGEIGVIDALELKSLRFSSVMKKFANTTPGVWYRYCDVLQVYDGLILTTSNVDKLLNLTATPHADPDTLFMSTFV